MRACVCAPALSRARLYLRGGGEDESVREHFAVGADSPKENRAEIGTRTTAELCARTHTRARRRERAVQRERERERERKGNEGRGELKC
eukprot:5212471-Pleurochrysis_carterae.AAC.1